jgi:uncharacterized DUF497 family protein
MPFEYNVDKSRANLNKHGIDFEQAQELWNDAKAIEKKTSYQTEERFARTGRTGTEIWTAFFTHRRGNIRLISVRRVHPDEERAYYGRGS